VGTALSRLTGFAKIFAVGYALGATRLTDTYNFANATPNVIYELLLGGVLTASLVPLFVEHHDHDDDDATSAVVSVSIMALLGLTVAAVLAAPLIVRLYTLNLHNADTDTVRAVGTRMARLFLPQIFFYGLIAVFSAVLNARRKFVAPAFTPVLNNVAVIAVVLLTPKLIDGELNLTTADRGAALVWLLGLGTTAGIAVSAVAMTRAVRRAGIRLRWRPQPGHPAVRQVVRMSGWTLGYVAANQIALLIITRLALGRPAGDQSAYLYAFTFFMLPHGLLAVSLMTTFAPDLARRAHRNDLAGFASRMHLGLRALGLLVIPSSVGYLVLSKPLIIGALRHGEFTRDNALLTGRVLAAFALGLFGFSAYLFILRGFYALRDAKTPFILNLGENAVNVILAVAFVKRWGVVGLAASYAVAYLSSAALAYVVLCRRIPMATRSLAVALARYVVAAAVMGLSVWTIAAGVDNAYLAVCTGLTLGAVVYLGCVVATAPLAASTRRRIPR
jgi:putative peptidoglycan lipid II flippase